MTSREAHYRDVAEGEIARALDEAIAAAGDLVSSPPGASLLPAMRKAHLEIENSVFLLKLASGEDGAPAGEPRLEKLRWEELVSRMVQGLGPAKEAALSDPLIALKGAREARDSAAALHSLNLKSRRRRR